MDSTFKETQMTALKEHLFDTLKDLVDDDFKEFKWFLNSEKPPIPVSRLENAKRTDTVNLMIQTYYTDTPRVTVRVLRKMKKTDLVKKLSKNIPISEGPSTSKTYLSEDCKVEWVGDDHMTPDDPEERLRVCTKAQAGPSHLEGGFSFEPEVSTECPDLSYRAEQQSSEVPSDPQHQTQMDSTFKETQMAELKEHLFDILKDLVDDDFKEFKWFLNSEKPPIPISQLENAKRTDTVNLMIQTYYTDTPRVTVTILEKMKKTDLVKKLSKNIPISEDNVSKSRNRLRTPLQNVSPKRKLKLVRRKFVKCVSSSVLSQLLDSLLEHEVINDEEMEAVQTKSRADGARDLIDKTLKKGPEACSHLISALLKADVYLSRRLKLS
ncbi:uncharacterized protein LOC115432540 isoform X2 [Sphaeramia orbicularis]|uniref:uncharacterized protein LOC115432540 isoform X2 n=1 Tax=Sphaeramia orbicularis TaxID=375764 RepID=UPI00117C94C9|nr:caspase recruitment domain-containing protein 16 isoform X2 [Sphaeramia orbicularis]